MQRVRIGLTGLGVVFLVVLLAAALVSFHGNQQGGSGGGAADAANGSEAPPADPLAELGVAPGGTAGESDATLSNAAER